MFLHILHRFNVREAKSHAHANIKYLWGVYSHTGIFVFVCIGRMPASEQAKLVSLRMALFFQTFLAFSSFTLDISS